MTPDNQQTTLTAQQAKAEHDARSLPARILDWALGRTDAPPREIAEQAAYKVADAESKALWGGGSD